MSPQTENSRGGSYGGSSFEQFDFNVDQIEPDAYPGEYTAVIDRIQFKMTQSTNRPMMVIDWKMTATEDTSDECQKSIGCKVTDWVVLAGDKAGNQGKVKLRTLRDALSLDPDIIPSPIKSFEDLKELAAALKGQSTTVWITNKTDGDGNVRTNVGLTAPRGSGIAPMGDEEVEEEPEARAPARRPAGGSKTAPKKGARR